MIKKKETIKQSNTLFYFALFLIFAFLSVGIVTAETSVAWTKDIGDVTAADMSEDGSVIYAAVGSQIFVYDSAGVQQNTFTVGGTVVKLVCTDDGSKAALYTDTNSVYFINNGAITWSESFTGITDIDISNAGNLLIVEGTQFHKYLVDGSLEYDSSSGIYNLGVIDPNDVFAIVGSSGNVLQKYILSTSDQYWAKVGDNSFNTNFSDFQNLLIIYTNPDHTEAIILSNATLGDELWEQVYDNIAVSNESLIQDGAYNYYDTLGDWTQATASAGWSARYAASSWVFDNKLWIGGGYGASRLNDVWYSSNGIDWTQATASAAWSKRHYAHSWVFDNKLWIGGGSSQSGYLSDVWYSSNGIDWTQATASAGWAARGYACSWVYDNKLWIAGGYNGNSHFNDVWYSSNGIDWTQATASAAWSARRDASSWVYDNKLWIGGGYRSSRLNDVWYSSNGIDWTQATASAGWSARYAASSWVFDNKLWIGGGYGSSALNDVWYSSNGIDWTQATASAGWSARYKASSWVFDNKLWIGGGHTGAVVVNNIWDSLKPVLKIMPSASGQTYLFYNYTGGTPSHTQTPYTNAVDFSGTYELRTKPTLSIYNLQTTKTLTGNISALSLSDRGDWVGTATVSRIYHDQITSSGFGTEYYAALGSTGTIYDIATANSAAMSVVGQGQITDIYSMSASRVGTYTAGGAVTHVDIADKNALWASSGGEDGKVYIFSKDASSNWYLEYSSDSDGSVTALSMSARGEFVLAGRTGSLTLYQTNTPEIVNTDFWFTLYAYKDSDSYRNAAINVSVYNINNQWQPFTEGLTDSVGKYVVKLTAGNSYKFDIGGGEKILIYQASPSIISQTVSIYTTPISSALKYGAEWNSETNSIDFDYSDSAAQTQSVTVRIQRTDNWDTVYENTFSNQQSIEETLPILDDTVTYKVEFSARRVQGVSRNTFFVSSGNDIIPIPLDQNLKNVIFSCFLILLAGLFSYFSAIRGAIVVALAAVFFVYLGWLTIPWQWLIVAIVIALLAGFTQRRS